jgi:hypothetical protein
VIAVVIALKVTPEASTIKPISRVRCATLRPTRLHFSRNGKRPYSHKNVMARIVPENSAQATNATNSATSTNPIFEPRAKLL